MKRILIILGMLVISLFGFGQVSKQQAINSVLNSVVGDDVDAVNVYMDSVSRSDSFYKLSRYDSIQSPYANYWLFFIDDMPEYGWGHDCRYVFVNAINGEKHIRNSQTPPWHYKVKLETVSEPIVFSVPTSSSFVSYDTNIVVSPVEGKYAVLFSGGEENGNDQTCFWNALSHSYCGLIENGFKEENIFVLSFNGDTIDEDGNRTNRYMDLNQDGTNDIIEEVCSVENLQSVFNTLAMKMEEGDLLYVYGTMHGFNNLSDSTSYGLWLWNQEPLYDTVFASMLSSISCSQIVVSIWSCFSGGMADEILSNPNSSTKKTVLTCIDKNNGVIRNPPFSSIAQMDVYNYFLNTAFRYHHAEYNNNAPWNTGPIIGELQDSLLFSTLPFYPRIDINYDLSNNCGNGMSEIMEAINYVAHFDTIQFKHKGVKHYDCGFKDDLLSLHGITGKVVTIDTVSGSFHIEDTLSVCAHALRMEDFAKFYLFDADLIIEDTATLVMGDTTAIIARSGNCRIIIKGSLTIGNGVTFEARDGATLEIIYENDADLAISNATFINCKLDLPSQNLSFDYCHFDGTPLEMNNTSDQSSTAIVTNCVFKPNGSNISNAVYIKNFAHYKVSGCTIDSIGGGAFKNGIAVYNSGSNSGWKLVSGNEISGCLLAGIQMYASSGSITTNTVYGNGYGIKLLNNCNIASLSGNCGATTESGTQFIHDNTNNEVYMTGSSVPQRFRYNAIHHSGNIPYVYYDAYVTFGDEGEPPHRGSLDVKYNHWGSDFVPTTHLYTNLIGGLFEYNPEWVLGDCHDEWVDALLLLDAADSLNAVGAYDDAKLAYKQVVEDYPETVSAETALKSLLTLETYLDGDYETLQEYYLSNESIASNETLSHLAFSLANKCDELMGNYEDAIAWYENVLTDPNTSFNDSIFAVIDLGELYQKMDAGGEKGINSGLKHYVPASALLHKEKVESLLPLIPKELRHNNDSGFNDTLPKVSDFEVALLQNDTVALIWNIPSEAQKATLSWCNISTNTTTFGNIGQMQCASDVFHHFDAQDMSSFLGWQINDVSMILSPFDTLQGPQKHYFARIWVGPENDMCLLFDKELESPVYSEIITIPVDSIISIGENQELRFGYHTEGELMSWAFDWQSTMAPSNKGIGIRLYHDDTNNECVPDDHLFPTDYYNLALSLTIVRSQQRENVTDATLTGYRVYREGTLIKEIPYSFVTYYTDTEFTRGFDVEYCVTAVYGDEESEPVCATVNITGVGAEHENDGVTILPNPTNGYAHIEGIEVAETMVYNTLGQLVKTFDDTNEINLKGLPQGMYLLQITDESGTIVTRKIVVK